MRIYDLSSESIWIDETFSLKFSRDINEDLGHPPLYFLFLGYWTDLFGNSEFAIRFLSVIFGSLSILLLYFFAGLLFNKKAALLSTFIFSINPFHIYLSQQARMYSLFTLFSLLSLYYFLRVLKEKKKVNYGLYFIFNLLNLYTHYFAVYVLFIEILYFILFYKNFKLKLKDFILTNLLVLILFSPQFLKIYNGFLSITSDFNYGLKPEEYFFSIFNSFLGWNTAFTIIVFSLFLIGLLRIKNIDKKLNLFGIFYVLLPLVIGFFLSFKMAIAPRHFIFILPIYIMFVSKGLINIKYKWIQILLISGILFISGFKLAEDYSKPNHAQWREVVEYIEKNSQKNDIILFDAGYTQLPFDYYYKGNLTRIRLWTSVNLTKNKIFYNKIKLKLKTRVWLILSDDFVTSKYYKYRLEHDFKLISSKNFFKVRIYLYENKSV